MPQQLEPETRLSVAVIGGGISGLAAAYYAQQHPSQPQVRLFEGSSVCGGVIQTVNESPLRIDLGPDMFTTREPDALELVKQLGIADRLIQTNQRRRGAYIVRSGKLIPVPDGMALMAPRKLGSVLKSPLLSPLGRLRLASETLVRRRASEEDECLADFATRRFGKEAYQWLIQPLISGIYTADPEKLSMRATMAEFVEMESQHGSLVRAVWKSRKSVSSRNRSGDSGARYSLFTSFDEGMAVLPQSLCQSFHPGTVQTDNGVTNIRPVDASEKDTTRKSWMVECRSGQEYFDRVILALPTVHAVDLVKDWESDLANAFHQIPYASTAVVVLVVPREQIQHSLNAFGMVVPLAESRQLIAASFANHKFAGRSADDHVIIRCFMGGACQPELLEHSDPRLISLATKELQSLIGLSQSAKPVWTHVARWMQTMPQYEVGHLDRVNAIDQIVARFPGFEVAGNAYRGVGIPACIRSSREAVARVLADRSAV